MYYINNSKGAFTSSTGITFLPGIPTDVPTEHLEVMAINTVDKHWLDNHLSPVETKEDPIAEPTAITPVQPAKPVQPPATPEPAASAAPTPAPTAPAAPAAPPVAAPAPAPTAPQTVGAPLAAPERLERFTEIVKLLDSSEENWTANGAPQVSALNNALEDNEREFSAAERNELWTQMNA